MGYYLEHVWKDNKMSIIVGIIFSVVSIIATCLITYLLTIRVGTGSAEQLESFFNCFVCIPAMTVYLGIKSVSTRIKSQRAQKLLSVFGSAVFGVYLIEKFMRLLTGTVYTLLLPLVGSFIASLVWCLATCSLAFLIIISLKHIPIVKKLVNKFI